MEAEQAHRLVFTVSMEKVSVVDLDPDLHLDLLLKPDRIQIYSLKIEKVYSWEKIPKFLKPKFPIYRINIVVDLHEGCPWLQGNP